MHISDCEKHKRYCTTSSHSNSSADVTLILAYVLCRIDVGLYLYGFYIAPLLREEHIKCVQEERRPIDNILLLLGNFVIYRGFRYRDYVFPLSIPAWRIIQKSRSTLYNSFSIWGCVIFSFSCFKCNIHHRSWRLKPLTLGLQSQNSSANKNQQKDICTSPLLQYINSALCIPHRGQHKNGKPTAA